MDNYDYDAIDCLEGCCLQNDGEVYETNEDGQYHNPEISGLLPSDYDRAFKNADKEQIVVIKDTDDEIMYVLKITNYDRKFDDSLYETREIYEENCLETMWEDGNGEQVGISIEDFVLQRIEEAGYEYEFTGFETFVI